EPYPLRGCPPARVPTLSIEERFIPWSGKVAAGAQRPEGGGKPSGPRGAGALAAGAGRCPAQAGQPSGPFLASGKRRLRVPDERMRIDRLWRRFQLVNNV